MATTKNKSARVDKRIDCWHGGGLGGERCVSVLKLGSLEFFIPITWARKNEFQGGVEASDDAQHSSDGPQLSSSPRSLRSNSQVESSVAS